MAAQSPYRECGNQPGNRIEPRVERSEQEAVAAAERPKSQARGGNFAQRIGAQGKQKHQADEQVKSHPGFLDQQDRHSASAARRNTSVR
jgi:hypothetical protein